jgi:hypothetical protein
MPDDDQSMLLWLTSVETIRAATERVEWMYSHIEKHHGAEAASKIFLTFGKKLSKTRLNRLKNMNLYWLFDQMEDPNVAALAREVFEKNAERSRNDQLTPRPNPSVPTLEKHLRELIKKRDEAERAGTWKGPPSRGSRASAK